MIDKTFAFLGAGNMANALIKGLLRAGTKPTSITATVKRTTGCLSSSIRTKKSIG